MTSLGPQELDEALELDPIPLPPGSPLSIIVIVIILILLMIGIMPDHSDNLSLDEVDERTMGSRMRRLWRRAYHLYRQHRPLLAALVLPYTSIHHYN